MQHITKVEHGNLTKTVRVPDDWPAGATVTVTRGPEPDPEYRLARFVAVGRVVYVIDRQAWLDRVDKGDWEVALAGGAWSNGREYHQRRQPGDAPVMIRRVKES